MTDNTLAQDGEAADLAAAADVVPDDAEATRAPAHAAGALILICIAQLMVVLDSTIANIALPYIGKDLDMESTLQWIVTGYALAFGGLLLLGGRLGDIFGRRRIFMIGLVIFAIASALGGVAQNEAMLLSSRGLQGLGAALAAPTALALITTTFPAGPLRNRAFSVYAAMSGVGAAVGLVLGGWLTGIDPEFGWRLTFLINVPIGLVAAYLAPRLLPDTEAHAGQLDVVGALLGTLGLVSLVYGISYISLEDSSTGQPHGFGDPVTLFFIGLGVTLLVAFIMAERRVSVPLMPLSILANRTRGVAFVTMMITPAAMFSMFFFLSLYVQDVMGYSPLHTGLAFLPFTVGMVGGATASSRLIAKVDPRYIVGTGTILAGLALFMFHRLSIDASTAGLVSAYGSGAELGDSINYWTAIAPWILVMALGMGLSFVPLTLIAVHGIRHEDSGIGSGVLNTMQQVGGALGLATLSTIAFHVTSGRADDLVGSLGLPPEQLAADPKALELIQHAAFADGATEAFLVGAFMIWTASLIIWTLLRVKHTELATEEAPAGVH
ncbi:MFS transporter [Nocardioides sp. R-C-SC26]|uniref:MFS transporter n=1 Tax=Nocardioides sp. R-C-SC26 TaxID=2870414 RepID=UPI001E463E29|nr:MFS transporter [Nocardioides sp. R-C-SC26]